LASGDGDAAHRRHEDGIADGTCQPGAVKEAITSLAIASTSIGAAMRELYAKAWTGQGIDQQLPKLRKARALQ
jgi:hypothetical protein